jgi:hypothetical protein
MNSYRELCAILLVLMSTIVGCGGGGDGFDPNRVTVTVSPAAVTIPITDPLTLQATVKGLWSTCVSTINEWRVTENNGSPCTWFDSPPLGPCPGGTIEAVGGATSSPLRTILPAIRVRSMLWRNGAFVLAHQLRKTELLL